MDKMMWCKPEMNEFAFAANEYVAACGDITSRIYNFICNAAAGTLYYYDRDNNNQQEYLGSYYHPCKRTHKVEVDVGSGEELPFYEGFVDYNKNERENDDEHVAVWIEWGTRLWGEKYVKNAHAMKALSITEIEADKS
ncbi:MAG: hypothetical protein J6M56_04900 [Clostridia bacterium]|nr:hypothetical protein [Clostridia bacterium]